MSKSIYDEALEELTRLLNDEFDETPKRSRLNVSQRLNMFKKVKDALEKAQKQEKLLELYKKLRTVKDHLISCCESVDDEFYDIRKKETYLEKQIKELENDIT